MLPRDVPTMKKHAPASEKAIDLFSPLHKIILNTIPEERNSSYFLTKAAFSQTFSL